MSFESISGDAENNRASSGVSRRSVLKVGAHAAWAVPLVQVVAAAPASAATSGAPVLSFTTYSANYGTTTTATADPTRLYVTAQIKNTGGVTTGLQVTLTLPANLYDTAPTVASSNGWSASPATGSQAAGWTIVLTVTNQLAAGESSPTLTATLTLNDTAAWRKFDGAAFDLKISATATNPGAQGADVLAHVAAAPTAKAALLIANFVASYAKKPNSNTLSVGRSTGQAASRTKVNTSGSTSSVGPLSMTITIPKSGPFTGTAPSAGVSAGWKTLSTSTSASGEWLYVFQCLEKTAPNASSPDFEATFTLNLSATDSAITVKGDASGDRANVAPQVTANAPSA